MNGFARNCLNRARRPRPWDTDTGPILPGEPYRLEAARAVSQGGEAAADTAQELPWHKSYVVGTFSLTHIGQTGCFSRPSPISDGSRAQPKQARLGASDAFGGVPPSPTGTADGAAAAGGAAAAASRPWPHSPPSERRQRLADLLVARAQGWLLLPQLGEHMASSGLLTT